ncbi:MAG: hypothetical protein LBH18_04720 [Spirochaetaceae bacterium]|jgi:hypothetical protein|nr:hypothetical protein [Spirochaetaceae bacterium]
MGEGIIKRLLDSLRKTGDSIPDVRRGGNALRYRIADALMCAFAVFFLLYPSLLHFQRAIKAKRRRNNMETLFGVSEIPCDNKIQELMDGIEPGALSGVFIDNLRTAEGVGALKEYRVLDGGVLLAIDGLWYHASQKVWCDHCQHITKDGETTYYRTLA